VYELAKELQISSKELIELLMNEFSVDVKNHMSVIEDEDAELIKELIGENGSSEDKTIVDEYEEILAEEVNNQAKKRKKKIVEEVDSIGEGGSGVVEIGETITVKELSEKLGKPTTDVIRTLIFTGVMAAINQEIDFETAEKVCEKYECLV
ncbi:translation initiation factor IF-2 N-terminal domain-containing protein, partial [Clostridium perfringens]